MADRATAETGCRFDLAGGTFDIWPLGLLHPGARTINVAIDVPVRVELVRRPDGYRLHVGEVTIEGTSPVDFLDSEDGGLFGLMAEALDLPPVDATLESASPRGGGLGASSAISVALIAAGEALVNPWEVTQENLETGRASYEIFCLSCHGPEGDGLGHLYTSDRYPYPPADLVSDQAKALKDGEIYHSITVGYGIMGAHGGMIRPEDRWKIILHIRENLQK